MEITRPATEQTAQLIAENWQRVTHQVAEACQHAGRKNEVRIVGVSKYVGPELARQLVEAGCHVLGENRPQQLWAKHEWFSQQSFEQPTWHLIGHLQRNKARRTLPLIGYMHSVDSLRIAQSLSEEAVRMEKRLPILIEVNVTRDDSKTGLSADELRACLGQALELPGLDVRGLMAMSSHFGGGHLARKEFAEVRRLRDALASEFPTAHLPELSMGMSGDFREAIAEGATMVRIGSHLWDGIEG